MSVCYLDWATFTEAEWTAFLDEPEWAEFLADPELCAHRQWIVTGSMIYAPGAETSIHYAAGAEIAMHYWPGAEAAQAPAVSAPGTGGGSGGGSGGGGDVATQTGAADVYGAGGVL